MDSAGCICAIIIIITIIIIILLCVNGKRRESFSNNTAAIGQSAANSINNSLQCYSVKANALVAVIKTAPSKSTARILSASAFTQIGNSALQVSKTITPSTSQTAVFTKLFNIIGPSSQLQPVLQQLSSGDTSNFTAAELNFFHRLLSHLKAVISCYLQLKETLKPIFNQVKDKLPAGEYKQTYLHIFGS